MPMLHNISPTFLSYRNSWQLHVTLFYHLFIGEQSPTFILVSSLNSCSLNNELELASRDRMAHNKIIKCANLDDIFWDINLLCGRCIRLTCETWQ